MINVSPVGRNANQQEREEFSKYDAQQQIRAKFVSVLKEKFPDYGLTYVSQYPTIPCQITED